MVKEGKHKLTLDQPVNDQIKVSGELNECRSNWVGDMTITVESEDDSSPATILTGSLDQSALQGVLRGLYSLGIPLISVNYVYDA